MLFKFAWISRDLDARDRDKRQQANDNWAQKFDQRARWPGSYGHTLLGWYAGPGTLLGWYVGYRFNTPFALDTTKPLVNAGPGTRAGNPSFRLCASALTSMDSSRRETGDGRLTFGRSPK